MLKKMELREQKASEEEQLSRKLRKVQRKRDFLIYEYRKRCQAVENLEK